MTELETAKEFDSTELDGTEQEEYVDDDDGGFENDVDISGEEYPLRGRGAFRLAIGVVSLTV